MQQPVLLIGTGTMTYRAIGGPLRRGRFGFFCGLGSQNRLRSINGVPRNKKGGELEMEATKITRSAPGLCRKIRAGFGTVLLFTIVLSAFQAQAMRIETGNSDFDVRFDNTLTYSAVARVKDQNEELLENPNTDDAERNFDKGLVMNRLDLLSELDLIYKRFGIRLSGTAYYDQVYNSENDHDSPATANHDSTDYNEFTDDTQKYHGKNAELLDAFTWGAVDIGTTTLRYKAGQFGQQWGKAFFPPFGANSITGALAPLNLGYAATVPNVELKKVIMPVPQLTAGLQLTDNLEVGAIYQFQWEPNRLFAAGSYFSPADMVGPLGAERILAGPFAFERTDDVEARDDGQGGIQMTYVTPLGMELGLYALRVHSREFYVVTGLDATGPSHYYYLYPEDIEYYGASIDTNVGTYPLSVEVTYRRNAPLASEDISLLPGQSFDNDDDPLYPVGQTVHVDITSFSPGNTGRLFCDEYDVIFEIGIDHLLEVDKNEDMLLEETKDTAVMMSLVFTPKWYQALPSLDLLFPIGVTYSPEGRAAGMQSGVYGNHKGGSWNIGIQAIYNAQWKAGLTYTDYFGKTEYQHWNERDTIGLFVTRTF
jgi:hypothetical protein